MIKQETLPPMQDEPNQAEIDRQQAELLRAAAKEQREQQGKK